jgi:predicted nucleotidyltransferase component of viral defense system
LLLHEVLLYLSKNKNFKEKYAFKGGTCLIKVYFNYYRFSEDLDFVINQNFKNTSNTQVKKLLDDLRREIFQIFEILNLKTNKVLGDGWKMIHSDKNKIIGFEAITNYISIFDNSEQRIKIEISFRNKLFKKTQMKIIKHEFFNSLDEPIIDDNIKIKCIDLKENFAEKIRALVTRKNIAIRDLFDIYIILSKGFIKVDKKFVELCILKINETIKFNEEDLYKFINNLDKIEISQKEIHAVLKYDEKINTNEMIKTIISKLNIENKHNF